jgi:hypothetical protein
MLWCPEILQLLTIDILSQSTVMLTANVGFLAIPGVVISNINNPLSHASDLKVFTSTAQIASSISMLASIGSTVVGLLLMRHNRCKQKEDPAGAVSELYRLCLDATLILLRQATYLSQSTHPRFGLEPIAIIFSLPWALLMWAYVISHLPENSWSSCSPLLLPRTTGW